MAGLLSVVATPIGNLEDMTYRAVRVIAEADIVAAEDKRSAVRLLNHFGVRAKKLVSMFEGNEASRAASLCEALAEGKHVVVMSEAGTPAISDPGARLVRAAAEAGIRVEVLPGAVACITALVGSGLAADRFLYIGFPPRDSGPRRELFGTLRTRGATLVMYESPERVGATLEDLAAAFGSERRAVLARELTKLHEEFVRGTLGELAARYADEAPRGECTLVVAGAEAGAEQVVDVEAEMRALLATGLGPKDAAARLVVTTGKPRRQLYQLALSLKREAEADAPED